MRLLTACLALTLATAPIAAHAADYTWQGRSNAHGGVVLYASSEPEAELISLRCDGFDGRVTFAMEVEPAEGETSDSPLAGHLSVLAVDGKRHVFYGPLKNDGMFPGTPIAHIERGHEVLEALMAGRELQVFHVHPDATKPSFTASLKGTRAVFTEHLALCLP